MNEPPSVSSNDYQRFINFVSSFLLPTPFSVLDHFKQIPNIMFFFIGFFLKPPQVILMSAGI